MKGDAEIHRRKEIMIRNYRLHVVKDADERFRIYAAAEDPGTENWISTQGYANGQILIRTLLANPTMEATFKVIKLADIPDADRRAS